MKKGALRVERIANPVIYELKYENQMEPHYEGVQEKHEKLIFNYPTVYIVHHPEKEKVCVYIGETTDIRRRTDQHLKQDPKEREDWDKLSKRDDTNMFVIGHELFNKSLTLDIENKLMHYLSSVDAIKQVYNRRTNEQNEYYTSDQMEPIFSKIWGELHRKNKTIFPTKKRVEDAAIFKASPFHKLTQEQLQIKDRIMLKIFENVANTRNNTPHQLIMVNGEAGSGKTVLMSNLFYDLFQESEKENGESIFSGISTYLLVNHEQQLTVYKEIAKKLGIKEQYVQKPTSFINNHSSENPVDVVIVDEAHLLWTQGKQSYRGKNQLDDLLEKAKVVVIVFDENQILSTEQIWEDELLDKYKGMCQNENNYIELKNQMRIHSSKETVQWIRNIIDLQEVGPIPHDELGYDLRIFESPQELETAIVEKNKNENIGLSRIVATFDWEYSGNKKEEGTWDVTIGDWSMPWNLQLKKENKKSINYKSLAWAEQPQTIGEVGSTFTIQGFDLNYVGVIIGPSVVFRDGKIQFVPENSKNEKAVRNRTLSDGRKEKFGERLLKNELNVLLTRGVKGLYIYAVDPALQEELMRRQGEKNNGK